jgi:AraC-like DNA-binding protein
MIVDRRTSPAWAGRIALGPGWAVFSGLAGDNRTHRHPALQLALGDGQPVSAEVEGRRVTSAGLLIGPDVAHHLHPGPVWLLYVERESVAGRRLAATCTQGTRQLSGEECSRLRALWRSPSDDASALEALVDALAMAQPSPPLESRSARRLREVINALPQRPTAAWTLNALAAEAALSPSRFAHAFRDQTGMAVRPYLRWLRLAQALEAAGCGHSLTASAHAAGFADAAHFSRTMRRHFGITPGSVLAALRPR